MPEDDKQSLSSKSQLLFMNTLTEMVSSVNFEHKLQILTGLQEPLSVS